MNHLFVPQKESLELKEIGFNEPCLAKYAIYNPKDPVALFPQSQDFFKGYFNFCKNSDYTDKIAAPLYQQAFNWFREKHGITCVIMDFIDDETGIEWDYSIHKIGTDVDENGNWIPLVDYSTNDPQRKFKTYENAQLACLQKLIEICKNDNTTRS